MAELAVVPIQVEPNLQTEAESIFRELGYSVSEAIALFYQQVILNTKSRITLVQLKIIPMEFV